jgi:hypothetical protein
MRVSFLVYGVLYVVIEMIASRLENLPWSEITAMDVAAGLIDALLFIVICIAAVVAYDVARQRWGPVFRAWQRERLRAPRTVQDPGPIGVTSWRPGQQPVVPAVGGTARRPGTYATTGYGTRPGGHPFPEEPGYLL